jgi:prophage regulatory protein
METNTPPVRVLRFAEVSRITALSRTAIYGLIKVGGFPAPIKLGERASGWRSDEVFSWIETRVRGCKGAA